MQTIYADGIGKFAFHDGVVRLELMAISKVGKDKQKLIQTGSIAMSLPSLLRTREQLGQVIDNLVEQGVLTKKALGKTRHKAP
jgi:hypothetical protein